MIAQMMAAHQEATALVLRSEFMEFVVLVLLLLLLLLLLILLVSVSLSKTLRDTPPPPVRREKRSERQIEVRTFVEPVGGCR